MVFTMVLQCLDKCGRFIDIYLQSVTLKDGTLTAERLFLKLIAKVESSPPSPISMLP